MSMLSKLFFSTMMRRSAYFLSNNSKAHVTNVANTTTRALTVKTHRRMAKSKALTAKLQVRAANSTASATIVSIMATRKKSVASA